jgi:hypothetical protein
MPDADSAKLHNLIAAVGIFLYSPVYLLLERHLATQPLVLHAENYS